MSSRRGGGANNDGAVSVEAIPPASKKIVQSLKEIVSCPEAEIYSTLKECNMDPNEAVNRLLSQETFHEVKRKRDKKKERQSSIETRSRGGSSTSNRGARSGTDRYGGRGGSTQFSPPVAYKRENGTNPYTSSSTSSQGVAGNGTYHRAPAPSDPVKYEDKASTTNEGDGYVSTSQPSWVGVPGQKSLADIVKMGRPQSTSKSYHSGNNNLVHRPPSTKFFSSKDHGPKASDVYNEPGAAPDEWPLMEPPQGASMSLVWEPQTDAKVHTDQLNMPYDSSNQNLHSETDEDEAEEDDSVENYVGSDNFSSRKMQEDTSGNASLFNNDMYSNLEGSYQSNNHTLQNDEVEDVGVSVSSETANLQQLSIQEEEDHKASFVDEVVPSVVIPNHLQVHNADFSHLSFGSFGPGLGTGFSGPFVSTSSRSNMEDSPIEADASVAAHQDTRNPEYFGEESTGTATDGNSASQSELLKPKNPEVSDGNQYAFPSSSTAYTFENAQQLNDVLNYSQTSSQMQNLPPFSSAMQAYSNSLPSTVLAANVHPVRDSEFSYSPFPMAQPMPTKYCNTLSSVGGSPSISVSEALKAGFESAQHTPQNLSGASIATGPTLPQHLAAHPYSQPALPLGPFANMIGGYPFLPQSYTYVPPSGYHQNLAAVLPQYKNSVSVSSLPQSASIPSGYGAFGSSTTIPGNYVMNPPAAPAGSTISYDDLLSSQYKDTNHLLSLQQNENSAMWLHGPGSRTMSGVPASTYYSFQGQQSQQPGGFRQGQQPTQTYGALGYPNFYQSQPGMSLEHQLQNPRDGSHGGSQGQPKQSQQIWQNGY